MSTPNQQLSIDDVQSKLAAELAARLLPVPDILTRYDITASQLRLLMSDPMFRNMVREYRREWNSPMTAKDRVRMKAGLMVEESLMDVYTMFRNPAVSPTVRLESFKHMVGLADMAPRKDAPTSTGPAFSLTLNLGGDTSRMVTVQHPETQSYIEHAED